MRAIPLQERILSVIRQQQPLAVKDLPRWLSDIDRIALECAVNALMRANKVSRVNGYYDLIRSELPRQQKVGIAEAITEPGNGKPPSEAAKQLPPPSAEEELAANLPETGYCLACDKTKLAEEFQRSKFGKLYSKCISCMQKQGKRALAIDTTVKPTAAPVMGAPAISSEHPSSQSAQGTLTADLPAQDSEALSPAGTDSLVVKLRGKLSDLGNSIREDEEAIQALRVEANEREKLVAVKRVALDEMNDLVARLQKACPEAFT